MSYDPPTARLITVPGITTPLDSVGAWTPTQDSANWLASRAQCTTGQNSLITYGEFTLEAGTYSIDVLNRQSTSAGIITVQLSSDGGANYTTVGTVDGYSASPNVANKQTITGVALVAGRYRIRFLMATKNASSIGFNGYVEGFAIIRTGA